MVPQLAATLKRAATPSPSLIFALTQAHASPQPGGGETRQEDHRRSRGSAAGTSSAARVAVRPLQGALQGLLHQTVHHLLHHVRCTTYCTTQCTTYCTTCGARAVPHLLHALRCTCGAPQRLGGGLGSPRAAHARPSRLCRSSSATHALTTAARSSTPTGGSAWESCRRPASTRTAPSWQCHRGPLLASQGRLEYSSYWLRHAFGGNSPGRPDPNGKLAVRP